jgi:hypothetical protein
MYAVQFVKKYVNYFFYLSIFHYLYSKLTRTNNKIMLTSFLLTDDLCILKMNGQLQILIIYHVK